jgi:hypothetical protein
MTNVKKKRKFILLQIRFGSGADHRLVRRAAKHARLSMNAWLVRVALAAAGRELASGKLTPGE